MKLEDRIYNVEYYVKKFNSWDVKEIIIDDQKAFWEIRKPGSHIGFIVVIHLHKC